MDKPEQVPERLWLLGIGGDAGEVTWCADPDPTGDFDGLEPRAVEYVRADRFFTPHAAEVERLTAARCIQIVREVRDNFLSEEYATPQPIGSFSERFACDQVADAIGAEYCMGTSEQRRLLGMPSMAEEARAALTSKPEASVSAGGGE